MMRASPRYALCALGLVLGACAGRVELTARALTAREIAARVAQAPAAAPPSPLALAIHGEELLAFDILRGALRFRAPIEPGAQAELLGDVVWIHSARSVHALDAGSGAALYTLAVPQGRSYAGATRAGDVIAWAAVRGTELDPTASTTLRAVDARAGVLRFERELAGFSAAPIAVSTSRGALLLVPQQRQRIIVLDARSGEERTRLRAQADAIDWVLVDAGSVLFGGRRAHRLTASDTQPAGTSFLPDALGQLPGRPEAPRSAYATPGTAASMRRVALYAALDAADGTAEGSGVALRANRAYFAFYGHLFGFDARGELVLARRMPGEVLDARVLDRGLLVLLANGELQLLSHANGATLFGASLNASLASAQLPPWQRWPDAQPLSATTLDAPRALQEGLLAIARDVDTRLVPSRVLAAHALAALPDPDLTRDLLELYEQPSTPPELQRALTDAIATRRVGLQHLIAALDRRYGFLAQTRPAPLALIAKVMMAAHETRAVPKLLERFRDHETPLPALARIADALGSLGDTRAAPELLAWLRLYRNDGSVRDAPEVLAAVGAALVALRGDAGRQELRGLLADGGASASASGALTPLLDAPVAVAQAGQAQPARPARIAPRPYLPSQAAVDAAFAKQLEALRACFDAERARNPKLAQVRIAFVAEADGSAHAFHFTPTSAQLGDCMYPLVASVRVPAFAKDRAVLQATLDARSAEQRSHEPVAAPEAVDADTPWWSWRMRATREVTQRVPWWHSEQPLLPRLAEAPPADAAPADAPIVVAPAPASAIAPAPPPVAVEPSTPLPKPAEPDRWWLPAQP